MKSGHHHPLLILLTVLFPLVLFLTSGCSTDATTAPDDADAAVDATISAIEVTAAPMIINPGGTTSVEATVYDSSGHYVSGIDVSFSIDKPTLASVDYSAITNGNGVAKAQLTAHQTSGEVLVTASYGEVSDQTTISITTGSLPDAVSLTVDPASILVEGTASVRAEVLDEDGNPVSNGTVVSFSSEYTAFGDFTSGTATTTNGFATATFEAGSQQGTATISAQAGDAYAEADIIIYPAEATSVQFVSADPQRIARQPSADETTSIVQFVVNDSNGNPVQGKKVSFSMYGPNGGEAIDTTPGDSTPGQIVVSSDADGIAQVILSSGSVAGPVTITATITVNGIDISSESSVISIGGGVPSAKRFSVAASTLNLPGLAFNNVETEISAYLADRFGNYNVLEGTSVSFVSELGLAIDTSDVTIDENGIATAIARTQASAGSWTGAEDVLPNAWEENLLNNIRHIYGISLPGNPRDGLSAVMVYVKGEEYFEDWNANGVYNSGEVFTDTDDDPFVDYNDNDTWDDGSLDPFEEYIDANGNYSWDGENGTWDSDKNIFYNFNILLTGQPYLVASSLDTEPEGFYVPDSGQIDFTVIVCDRNGNPLISDSTVSVENSIGTLYGPTSYTFGDTNVPGPLELSFTLADDNKKDEDPAEAATITITVSWQAEGVEVNRVHTVLGSIN